MNTLKKPTANSVLSELCQAAKSRNVTILCIGPVTKNCVDAAIELAGEYSVPLILIASRRQVEIGELGGGYVNNWTTQEFSAAARQGERSDGA